MKKSLLTLAVAAVLLFANTGCAVMFGGSKYQAQIKAQDPNTEIWVNGRKQGIGEANMLVKRKDDLRVTLKAEGKEDNEQVFPKKLRATFAADFLTYWFFLPAIIIDFATGATYKPDDHIQGVERINTKNYRFDVKHQGSDK